MMVIWRGILHFGRCRNWRGWIGSNVGARAGGAAVWEQDRPVAPCEGPAPPEAAGVVVNVFSHWRGGGILRGRVRVRVFAGVRRRSGLCPGGRRWCFAGL